MNLSRCQHNVPLLFSFGLASSLFAQNFIPITSGNIVTDAGSSHGMAWGDYDGDGNLDLFVANFSGLNNFLYHNNGDGTFTKITAGSIVNDGGNSTACAWGDYDNDGHLDLFVANYGGNNFLYHNNGDGTFTRITSGNIVTDGAASWGCAWGDYDNDGYLDLYVANASGGNFLYHNNEDGTFSKITTGTPVTDVQSSDSCAWGDYDNDGWLDLFVANGANENNSLYHNNHNGTFTKITVGSIVSDGGLSVGCAWGDYDNDGYLDLFVPNRQQQGFLYHNNGDGTFTKVTSGSIATGVLDGNGCSWGDYNNDGYLDLFVADWNGQNDALYQNNGDGTFTRITTGNLVTDAGNGVGCGWGDFNNDGRLDLFVSNGGGQSNFLYRNDGNNNNWITIKCVGTASNRSGIGARVRVGATIQGTLRSQVRQISSANGWDGQALDAHFGLGNATVIATLRVEWPSGAVQTLNNVAVAQTLTVNEPNPSTPVITAQPQSSTVGFGANVSLSVQAAGAPALSFQWSFNGIDILGATSATLTLNSVDGSKAGAYAVVVSNSNGSVQSHNAILIVDSTFTKLTAGNIVTDAGNSHGIAWGDYDGDGNLDLFVANASGLNNFLYHNKGDGTFTKITTGSIVNDGGNSTSCAWGDYDNDGHLDLFVANAFESNFLYHNNGNGTFTRITSGNIVTDVGASYGCAWGDYDNDGYLDLYVASSGGTFLYHNNGNGTFSKITTGTLATDIQDSGSCAWGDYDNDGRLDLFVAKGINQADLLYHNNGDGTFTKVTNGGIVVSGTDSIGCAWGDYDNDGYLDLYVPNRLAPALLYHNNGNGTFTRITSGSIATDVLDGNGCTWGDYNNDGYLDLFVAGWNGQNDALYRNNGDGTFTRITTGNLVTDAGNGVGCGWGDFNNDGQLDLFVSNSGGQNNFLYRNDGNNNGWITIKCVGAASNRSGIGARVKVDATIQGTLRSQVRQISSANGWDGQGLSAHFGLQDATLINNLRIEWPSGVVQVLQNVAVNQTLTVTEPSSPADVSIVISATPNPVVQGSLITYTIIVGNNGPGTAVGVKVTDVLPSGLSFLFALSTQGSCSGSSTMTCNLGALATSSSAVITIVASPALGGVHPPTYLLANTVTVTANSTDPSSFNNSDTATSTVRTDSDGDGLPDDYEDQNGLDKNSAADASLDLDGDGFSNLQEFLVGTDPRNPLNAFAVTDTELVGNNVRITFSTASGKTYSAQYSDTSPSGPWAVFASGIPGTGGLVQVLDLGGATQPLRFYRAEMTP